MNVNLLPKTFKPLKPLFLAAALMSAPVIHASTQRTTSRVSSYAQNPIAPLTTVDGDSFANSKTSTTISDNSAKSPPKFYILENRSTHLQEDMYNRIKDIINVPKSNEIVPEEYKHNNSDSRFEFDSQKRLVDIYGYDKNGKLSSYSHIHYYTLDGVEIQMDENRDANGKLLGYHIFVPVMIENSYANNIIEIQIHEKNEWKPHYIALDEHWEYFHEDNGKPWK